jgi:hypothetical protein
MGDNVNLCPNCKLQDTCKLGGDLNRGLLDFELDNYLGIYQKDFKSFPFVEIFITECEKFEEETP